ncbi:MAG: hypothetical protein HYW10_02270, partial [Candidatus Omnitrophica bacterium]|nr:hypothetical protein [Candidatus Omnitrophota bacterium]
MQRGLIDFDKLSDKTQATWRLQRHQKLLEGLLTVIKKTPAQGGVYPPLDEQGLLDLPESSALRLHLLRRDHYRSKGQDHDAAAHQQSAEKKAQDLRDSVLIGRAIEWADFLIEIEEELTSQADKRLSPLERLFDKIRKYQQAVETFVGPINFNDPSDTKKIGAVMAYVKFAERFGLSPDALKEIFKGLEAAWKVPQSKELARLWLTASKRDPAQIARLLQDPKHQKLLESLWKFDPELQGVLLPLALSRMLYEWSDEQSAQHIANLHVMLANRPIRELLKRYYDGLRVRINLDPMAADERERQRVWGQYAIRTVMVESLNGTYNLDEAAIRKTLEDLIA